MSLTNEYIQAAIHRSLEGEEFTGLLSVDFSYDAETKSFILKFLLSHEPTETDYELAGIISTEFASYFNSSELMSIREECYCND